MSSKQITSAAKSGAMPLITVFLVLGSAAIHFAVAPGHMREYVPFGIFFIAAGVGQLALAALVLVTPTRRVLLTGAAGTAAVILLWALSRTVGLPIGPAPWRPEMIGFTDVVCTTMEATSAALLVRLATRRPTTRARRAWRTALAVVPVSLLVALLSTVASASALTGMPQAFNASPTVPGKAATNLDLLTEQLGSEPVRSFTLTAEVTQIAGQSAWTYDGTVPGPELHVRQGDRLRVTLVNRLPKSTTIHWHGVPSLPDAEDGVAGITQQAVPPGHQYTYEFVAREPGTYWYHSHQDTGAQLTRGLYGALVVDPSGGPTEARDYTVVLHPATGGNAVAFNGTSNLRLAAAPGETVRLRIVNAFAPGMDGGPETPTLLGAPFKVVALDGRDLSQPESISAQRVPLGMGQRADLVFTMPGSGAVRLVDAVQEGATTGVQSAITALFAGPTKRSATVTIGDGPVPPPSNPSTLPLFDPTRYGRPAKDAVATSSPDATLPVVLAEHPGFRDGVVQLVHTINGEASPYVPPITVHEGQTVRLHIVNDTGEYHPIHLHGHTMSVLSQNGRPIQGSPIHLDSLLVGPHETWDVAFKADNPGIWMVHCHVLLHATFGMSMTVNYAGVSTPYEMGSRSGNMPE